MKNYCLLIKVIISDLKIFKKQKKPNRDYTTIMSQTNRNFKDKNKSEAVQEGTSKAAFELGITTSREGESGVPSRGETPMEIARLNSRNDERMQYSQLNLPDATERILNKRKWIVSDAKRVVWKQLLMNYKKIK